MKKHTVYNITVKTAVLVILAGVLYWIHVTIPGFFSTLIKLTWEGNVDGLSAYVSSFGYWAYAISVFMIALCNVTGLPSIPFLTVNGVIFGLLPGLVVSWLGEVIGVELSFYVMRLLFRQSTQRFIERRGLTAKVKSYSTLRNMTIMQFHSVFAKRRHYGYCRRQCRYVAQSFLGDSHGQSPVCRH